MKLSVLLPTHNRSDVLPFAIESVLAQTFVDFELLICGDGCTDSTAEVVARYAAVDSRVRWFDLPKAPGFGYANRNVVLREARGDLIGFVAHDDIVTSDHFALLVQALEDPEAQLAYTEAVWVGRDGAMVPAVFHFEDNVMLDEFLARRWSRIPSTCFIHRRDVFEKVGWWSEVLLRAADWDLWCRIIQACGLPSLRSVPVLTCFHFRALWRLDELAPDTEPVWRQLHQEPGRLADAMRWPVPAGMVEQEAFWRRLQSEPEIVPRLRDACRHALATYAWHLEQQLSAQSGLAPVVELEKKIQSLREKNHALKQQVAEQKSSVKRLRRERDELKRKLSDSTAGSGWWRRIATCLQRSKIGVPAAPPPADLPPMSEEQIQEQLGKYAFYHIIPLSPSLSTPGNPAHTRSQQPVQELIAGMDLKGRRVLDVGCRDGLYSFQAERQGASEVVGIDNDLSRGAVEFLIPFFKSKVRMQEMNLLHLKRETFGVFDLIIFAGVLYHLRYPFQALRVLRDVLQPGGRLVMETAMFHGQTDHAMLYCPVGDDSPYNATSCTFFNKKGLIDSLASLGFRTLSWSVLHPEAAAAAQTASAPVIDRAVLLCEYTGGTPNKEVDRYWNGTHSLLSDYGRGMKESGALKWKELEPAQPPRQGRD